ncbi:unnamed protein product [Cuscuta europaea]|uniref:Uncharacterized protein n=1 Tax=Cuscuta europaea TaxID=41803 RepID=A0A9P1DXV8_CUSEU|nr:unnamed protein product [Cuscuta europaea]
MGQHSQNSAKPSHSYKLFGIISKVTSLAEIYKAFSRKLHPADRSNKQRTSHRHQSNFISHDDSNPSIVRSQRQRDGEITPDREEKKRERSKEERDKPEEFVISSPKLLSRTTSRVAPTLSKSSSGGWPNFIDLYVHVKRSASVSSATSPMAFLSKTMSQRNINMAAAWRKPPPLEKKLECTLEELCFGCTKEANFSRRGICDNQGEAGVEKRNEDYIRKQGRRERRNPPRRHYLSD